jgi:hypothetical protein
LGALLFTGTATVWAIRYISMPIKLTQTPSNAGIAEQKKTARIAAGRIYCRLAPQIGQRWALD